VIDPRRVAQDRPDPTTALETIEATYKTVPAILTAVLDVVAEILTTPAIPGCTSLRRSQVSPASSPPRTWSRPDHVTVDTAPPLAFADVMPGRRLDRHRQGAA
jgi:hypothetical protein